MRHRYGRDWPDAASDLTIELAAFKQGITEERGGLGKVKHFQNVVDTLLNKEGSRMRFDWNPWVMKMLTAACEHKYIAVAGCASSSKTDFFVVWGLVNFAADPANTTIILTSTSLKDSRMRGWGRMTKYWQAIPGLPGRLVDSNGLIKFMDPETGATSSDSGIFLLAGDAKKGDANIGSKIGFKNRTIIVIADELAELSPAILDAAEGNLDAATLNFQFIGLSNPKSYFDPFGRLAKPKDGWGSITPDHSEWETDRGICLRFDGELSPNVLAGKVIYPYMIDKETIDEKRRVMGENSPQYWRMYRGYWCPTGDAAGLYTENSFVQYDAESREVDWVGETTRVAFLDTAFTNEGDLAALQFGVFGRVKSGGQVLLLDNGIVSLKSDVRKKDESHNYQIATQFRDICRENGVRISNAGLDATGGGAVFADLLATVWGTGFYRCYFQGSASDRIASSSDPRPGHEAFTNRVSEIWGIGVEFLRTGQLKGLYPALIKELASRLYKTVKKGEGSAICVETKKEMRSRTAKSPDMADAALGLIDLCRERLGYESVEGETLTHGEEGAMSWDKMVELADHLNSGEEYFLQNNSFFTNDGFIPLN